MWRRWCAKATHSIGRPAAAAARSTWRTRESHVAAGPCRGTVQPEGWRSAAGHQHRGRLESELDVAGYRVLPTIVRVKSQLSYFDVNLLADQDPTVVHLRSIARNSVKPAWRPARFTFPYRKSTSGWGKTAMSISTG